jgi:8-oxo-dGTP diphosphatase
VCAAAQVPDGRWLLIRRGDFGNWALAGGTVEWGETLVETLHRELYEEAGVETIDTTRLVGVFSRPDRDPRFHGITVVVHCRVSIPARPPMNPLEVHEVRLFKDGELPSDLAFGGSDFIEAARRAADPVLE